MRHYEFTFKSCNTRVYPKPITVLVLEPDTVNGETGAMLFTHGWGGNRFQHRDKMEYACEAFNLICLSVEYRMSGYDFNPVTGLGAYRPYDASFYQTIDVLNALRFHLDGHPGIDRGRLFHYGGSQGGHIALLSALYAPQTFAFVYASSPMTHLDERKSEECGRDFMGYELLSRDITAQAGRISTPIYLEHGTADENVPCEEHTGRLVKRLQELGKDVAVRYYEGGLHSLEPAITKLEAFKAMAPELMSALCRQDTDDFAAARLVKIPCGARSLEIDWGRPADDPELLRWVAADYSDNA